MIIHVCSQNIIWTGFSSHDAVTHTNVYPLVAVDGSVAQTVGSLQIEAEERARGETGHSEGPTLLVVRCGWMLRYGYHRSMNEGWWMMIWEMMIKVMKMKMKMMMMMMNIHDEDDNEMNIH